MIGPWIFNGSSPLVADVFSAAAQITTPIGILSFAIAAWLTWQTARFRRDRKRLELLPEEDRAKQVDEFLSRYGVDAGNLTREQKFNLIREEMQKRYTMRLYSLVVIVIALVICLLIVTVSWVISPSPPRPDDGPTPPVPISEEDKAKKADIESLGGRVELIGSKEAAVYLTGSTIQDRQVERLVEDLSGWRSIKTLDLTNTGITDSSVEELLKVKSIGKLVLDNTMITLDGYSRLMEKFGAVEWTADRSAAEAALKLGGRLRIEHGGNEIDVPADILLTGSFELPTGSFDILSADLSANERSRWEIERTDLEKKRKKNWSARKKIDDDFVKPFSRCKKLTELDISGTSVTNEGLQHVGKCESLAFDSVEFIRSKVSLHGVLELQRQRGDEEDVSQALTKLGAAVDEGPLISWVRFNYRSFIKNEYIHIPVSDQDLAHLGKLGSLKTLDLSDSKVGDAGLIAMAAEAKTGGFANLEELNVGGTQVTSDGIKHLLAFKKLRLLKLGDTAVGDQAIESLSQLNTLTLLYISGAEITPEGVERLRQELPDTCDISNP